MGRQVIAICQVLSSRGVLQAWAMSGDKPLVFCLIGTEREFQEAQATIEVGEGGVSADQRDWEAMFQGWTPGTRKLTLRYFIGSEYYTIEINLPEALNDQVDFVGYRITMEELVRLYGWWLRYCAGGEGAHAHIVSLIDQHLCAIRTSHH